MSGSKAFNNVDVGFYIAFGSAICANLQGLIISPILLKKGWKRNGAAVLANICFSVSNWVSFYQLNMECSTAVNISQVFMVLGSLFEVVAPMSRAYPLLSSRFKKIVPVLVFTLIIAESCSLIDLQYRCDGEESQFPEIVVNPYSETLSHILGIMLYIIAFQKIISLVDNSIFAKENGKMLLLRSIAKASVYFTIALKFGCWIGYLLDGAEDNEVEMAMKSNLCLDLLVSQLILELANIAASKPSGNRDSRKSAENKDTKQVDKSDKVTELVGIESK
eukprot:NODE_375_length_9841_cov_0.151098.p2 type:complete len:277 gc:universal NODE_375_length_9841_cov_0.151098:1593-763(-)